MRKRIISTTKLFIRTTLIFQYFSLPEFRYSGIFDNLGHRLDFDCFMQNLVLFVTGTLRIENFIFKFLHLVYTCISTLRFLIYFVFKFKITTKLNNVT